MSKPSVYFSLPPWELLRFPPDSLPPAVPPPTHEGSFRAPFGIQPWLYNLALRPEIPVTFAICYIISILSLNAYNKSNGNKPWAISKTKAFHYFVVAHNIALVLYSFATHLAMWNAISHVFPGWNSATGLAGVADSLCKMHGPRTLGDAVAYNSTVSIWESKNQFIKLTGVGNPDPTDAGRLWNEGLAFWGWFFYLSKFYEVLDTLVIVAKGKRSPTLQTYHHAGAMLCMWSGIRYMTPPIWVFCWFNSGIHTLMYIYFALAAVNVKVPASLKRSLTTMQIAQFVFGASYAALHLFVQYDIPIATPYKVAASVASAASAASSAFTSATSAVSSAVESPALTASLGAAVKKILLRAAGEEGAAERLGLPSNTPVAEAIESRLEQRSSSLMPSFETRYRTEYTRVNCLDTSGSIFATLLNLTYLAPLTFLFARFFVKSYLQRGQKKSRNASEAAKKVARDASTAEDETERAVEDAGKRAEDEIRHRGSQVQREVKTLHDQLREDVKKMRDGNYADTTVSERVQSFDKQVKSAAAKAKDQVNGAAQKANEQLKGAAGKVSEQAKGAADKAKGAADKANGQVKGAAEQGKERAKGAAEQGKAKANGAAEQGKDKAKDAAEQGKDKAESGKVKAEKAAADDSDAMGQSGVGVERSEANGQDAPDPAADAPEDGTQWKPPSANGA